MPSTRPTVLKSFAARSHDHGHCVETALAKAERACAASGRRLTPLRRRVLELIWASHLPVKAYDLLALLGQERAQAAPPTVYRALDFLLEAGLIHRLTSLNAYIGCGEPLEGHVSQFLICTQCGTVAELAAPQLSAYVDECARRLHFKVVRETIEVAGECRDCQQTEQGTLHE